jgi:amino acid transporter
VFARLAREMPNADGPYGYIRATLGDIPAFIAIWCYWVSLWITNAAIATGVVGYLGAVFPAVAAMQPRWSRSRCCGVRDHQPVRRAHGRARAGRDHRR